VTAVYGKTGYATKAAHAHARYLKKKAERDAEKEPDPILALTEPEKAYIAGIIDGEGCIRIGHVGPLKRTLYLTIAVGMCHRGVIEWLQAKLSSGTIKVNNHTKVRDGWNPQWLVRIHGKRAQLLCKAILPYMIVKREHAEIAAAFPCDCRSGPLVMLSPEVQEQRSKFAERMRVLNYRGPRKAK
jgi:hypothetical protein